MKRDRPARVVITRATGQAQPLARALEAAGARTELLPLIEVAPPADPQPLESALADLDAFDWIVFASSNAVEAVVERSSPPWPKSLKVAAVGRATEAALAAAGVGTALLGTGRTGEDLARDVALESAGGSRILVPRAADGRPELIRGLEATGLEVVAVEAYRKRRPAGAEAQARELFAEEIGWVTVTSPRIASELAELFGAQWTERRHDLRALSIGPTTTQALRDLGCEDIHEADVPGVDGLVRAWVTSMQGGRTD